MLAIKLEPGAIVQLNPSTVHSKAFASCLMIVEETEPWGVIGYVQSLGENRERTGGLAYYRAEWHEIEPTGGHAVWRAE